MHARTSLTVPAALLALTIAVEAQTSVVFEDKDLGTFASETRPSGVRRAAKIPKEIVKGDTYLLRFSVRSKTGAPVQMSVGIDPGANPFTKPVNMPADAAAEWREYQYPFAPRRAYAAGEATLSFSGKGADAVEIRDLRLVSYGTAKRPWELPVTRTPYAGSEPDAAWRRAADQRIEKHRKGDIEVLVRDAAGKPVSGAEVEIVMRKHAFGFGSAVGVPSIVGDRLSKEETQRYRDHVTSLFNKAVIENHLKWPQWAKEENRPATMTALKWLSDSGISVRGHVLVWPSWRWNSVPATLAAKNDPPALARAILERIEQTVTATRDHLTEWDVLNEPFDNHDFIDILGKPAMVDWFQAARKANPSAKLYINDFSILSGDDRKHQDHYYETIKFLLDNGAPVDGIGLQSHFPARVTPPEEVLRRLDRFASFGRDLQVTEFDIDTVDEQTQADYTRDFMTVIFSHPAIKGFMMWGFWESAHWKPDGAMIRADWSLKPNGHVYKDLVFNKWWTRANAKTAADGTCRTRGFLGDYEVRVRSGSKTAVRNFRLEQAGSKVALTLD